MCFEICKKPKWNLLSDRTLVQHFKMPNLIDECETIFLRTRKKNSEHFKSFLPILEFPVKLVWSLSKP